MKAYWRDDLEESGDYPACSEILTHEEWAGIYFEVVDSEDDRDFETEEGFNMIIRHTQDGRLLYVCSIDFNYTEQWK